MGERKVVMRMSELTRKPNGDMKNRKIVICDTAPVNIASKNKSNGVENLLI